MTMHERMEEEEGGWKPYEIGKKKGGKRRKREKGKKK